MATIVFSSIGITEIRGKAGGNIYSRNANGSYMRKNTKPTNPNTAKQQSVRGIFGQIAMAWKNLTVGEQNAWITAAANGWIYLDRAGNPQRYTGSQLFNKLNNALLQLDPAATPFTSPSPELSLTAIYQFDSVYTNTLGDALNITAINDGLGLPVGQQALLYTTGPISAGVYRPKKPQFKRLGVFDVAGGTIDISSTDAAYLAEFGQPVAGQVIWTMIETYAAATGQVLPGFMVRSIAI